MITPRLPHHLLLRLGPVLLPRERPDAEPLQERRELAVLRPGVPGAGSILQPQLGPATSRLLLLAAQPVAQRMNQIVVRQLIVFLTGLDQERGPKGSFLPFGIN